LFTAKFLKKTVKTPAESSVFGEHFSDPARYDFQEIGSGASNAGRNSTPRCKPTE